jgi:hypothetical protein
MITEGEYSEPFPLTADEREEALQLLCDVRQWRLPEPRWTWVTEALEQLASALAAADGAAARQAVAVLEQVGPTRAIPLGTPPAGPAPAPILLRTAELIHSLTSLDGDPDDAGRDADPGS